MAWPDSRAIDDAIVSVLAADPILAALMPGGVHWDIGPPGLTQFVSVAHADSAAALLFGHDDGGIERVDYVIKAIARSTTPDPVLDAAARIHDLLERQTLDLADTGYELMIMRRTRRVRYPEPIQSTVWQHAGGVYSVMVTAGTPTAA